MNHEVWCCYRVDGSADPQNQAHCVRVSDGRIETFFLDGRYDSGGKREHTLIEVLYEDLKHGLS